MELIMEQFPIVIHSLNVGFLQTLKLFFSFLNSVFCNASWSYSVGTGYCIWINVTF